MKAWSHTIISVLMAAVTAATPSLQALVSKHPAVSSVLVFLWAVLGHILPSPVADKPTSIL